MPDDQEFEFTIYHNGVHFQAPVRGRERFLLEREFLNTLVGQYYAPRLLPRPIPDPNGDFYMLDDAQLEAYSAFRRKMKERA
jgi:hypothetical protein